MDKVIKKTYVSAILYKILRMSVCICSAKRAQANRTNVGLQKNELKNCEE